MPRRKVKITKKNENQEAITALVRAPKRIYLFTTSQRVVFPDKAYVLAFGAGDKYSLERIERDGLIALVTLFDGEELEGGEKYPLVATILGVTKIDEENQAFLARPS